MSSRSKDSQRLFDLATQLEQLSKNNVQLLLALKTFNDDLAALHQQVADMDEALDAIERRLSSQT